MARSLGDDGGKAWTVVSGDDPASVPTPPLGLTRPDGAEHEGPDRRAVLFGGVLIAAGMLGLGSLVFGGGGDDDSTGRLALVPATTPVDGTVDVVRTTEPVMSPATTLERATTEPRTTPVVTNTTTTATTAPPATAPPQDDDAPSVVARPAPVEPPAPPPEAPPPPWADSVFTTSAGHISTDVGCARDNSAAALDEFFAARVGPVLGWDYQHVYDLGGGRYLWLFQDTFLDHSGTANTLDKSSFAHNTAMVQEGSCFRLLHRGTTAKPTPFELGTGTTTLRTWFWPMGGEVHDGRLYVFWAEMVKDAVDPQPPDGLGWHPVTTHIATYDPVTLARLDFRRAPSSGASPIFGYAVASDETHTYLFGNTFEQNLTREGGYWNGPLSGTKMFLGRVPRGQVFDEPEFWTPTGWTTEPGPRFAFLERHWAEFPMQPRYIDGQWVATTAVNGYWGDAYEMDVANDPWGPWTTVESRALLPRGADPKMNTYHAHLLPFRDGFGQLIVSVSNNARDMLADAWPNPARYRPEIFTSPWQDAPPPPTTTTTVPETTTTTTTTVPETTTTPPTTTTTVPTTTTTESTTTTIESSTTTTTVPDPTTTTSSTVPDTSSSTVPDSTTTVPPGATTTDPGVTTTAADAASG